MKKKKNTSCKENSTQTNLKQFFAVEYDQIIFVD